MPSIDPLLLEARKIARNHIGRDSRAPRSEVEEFAQILYTQALEKREGQKEREEIEQDMLGEYPLVPFSFRVDGGANF